jgi:hypothetical protein
MSAFGFVSCLLIEGRIIRCRNGNRYKATALVCFPTLPRQAAPRRSDLAGIHRDKPKWRSAMYIGRLDQAPASATSTLGGDLTPSFSLHEFASRGTPVPPEYRANVRRVAENLQVLRDQLGRAIGIVSGYRTPEHNTSVGGKTRSQHLTASAADIQVTGLSPAQTYCTIEELIGQGRVRQGGLGIYSTFVHYDIRGHRARWTGRGVTIPNCSSVVVPGSALPNLATVVTVSSNLNVRSGPGTGYSILAKAPKNSVVTMLGRDQSSAWVQVQLASGARGWASAQYLSPKSPIGSLPVTA